MKVLVGIPLKKNVKIPVVTGILGGGLDPNYNDLSCELESKQELLVPEMLTQPKL